MHTRDTVHSRESLLYKFQLIVYKGFCCVGRKCSNVPSTIEQFLEFYTIIIANSTYKQTNKHANAAKYPKKDRTSEQISK